MIHLFRFKRLANFSKLLTDHTNLFKLSSDTVAFKRWLSVKTFGATYESKP